MTTPVPKIHIQSNLEPGLSEDLLELVIEERLSQPSCCLARFSNVGLDRDGISDYKYFDLADFNFGDPLDVWIGVPPNSLYRLFRGRIQMIEAAYKASGHPEILIQSEDIFGQMKRRIRTRLFNDLPGSEVIEIIAAEYGLSAEIDLPDSPQAQLSQLNQSDFDFLAERVRESGGDMRLDGNQLIVKTQVLLDYPELELNVGEELTQFQVRADLRGQSTSMGVAGWDMRNKEPLRQSSDETDLMGANPLIQGGGRKIEEAFGSTLSNLVDANPTSAEEAEQLARVYYRESARRYITGTAVSASSWELKTGRNVTIQKAGKLFDGVYLVTAVRHRFDLTEGLRTEFEVERSFIGTAKRKQREKKNAKQ